MDWTTYSGVMVYNGQDGEDCGSNTYEYDSTGTSVSYYVSADGEYEAYYDFVTEELTEYSYSYYDEETSDDGLTGSTYYLSPDMAYYVYVSWDKTGGDYFIAYSDPETDIEYYADALWYYTCYEDLLANTKDEFYAEYFKEYDDGEGYTSVVYASPDWSYYFGGSTYETDALYSFYQFDSEKNVENYFFEYADGLYNSYYDAISEEFLEYVYTAPTDYYMSEVSEDGTTYTYEFVDADQCYSYKGIVVNTEELQTVYINENGHESYY
jgi:hypothetical protein